MKNPDDWDQGQFFPLFDRSPLPDLNVSECEAIPGAPEDRKFRVRFEPGGIWFTWRLVD